MNLYLSFLFLLCFNQYTEKTLPPSAREADTVFTATGAQRFYREEIYAALAWARDHETIPFVKRKVAAIYAEKPTVMPVISFYRDQNKIIWPGVLSCLSQVTTKDGVKKDAIMLFLPAFLRADITKLPDDKRREISLIALVHEFIHIEYQRKNKLPSKPSLQTVIDLEAAVWAIQVKEMLIPMQKAKRLPKLHEEVIRAFNKHGKSKTKWREWIRNNRSAVST